MLSFITLRRIGTLSFRTYLDDKEPGRSCVEDDLWDLSVLDAGAVVVAGGVAELEGDLAAVVAVDSDLPQPLGAVVTVEALQGAHLHTALHD